MAPSLTPRCSSYWKGWLRVSLNYGHQLNLYIIIFTFICVTLFGWSAKQTIPSSLLARNQTKGLESRSPTRQEVGEERQIREKPGQWARERQRRSWKKELREGNWRRETQRVSRQRSAMKKTVKDELAFLVACRSFEKNARQR